MLNVDIHAPGIAVICNAWAELNKDIHQKCFETTLNLIDSIPEISTVLLAGTHVTLNVENQGINCWYDNAKRIFVDEQGVDWIRRFWQAERDPGFATHNPMIRDHNYGGKLCLGIWEQWELEYLLNHYLKKEQNIWYFGSGLGVRRDPFGWALLCDLIRHKHVRPISILTHRFGMVNNLMNAESNDKCDWEWVDWAQLNNWTQVNDDIILKTDLEWD